MFYEWVRSMGLGDMHIANSGTSRMKTRCATNDNRIDALQQPPSKKVPPKVRPPEPVLMHPTLQAGPLPTEWILLFVSWFTTFPYPIATYLRRIVYEHWLWAHWSILERRVSVRSRIQLQTDHCRCFICSQLFGVLPVGIPAMSTSWLRVRTAKTCPPKTQIDSCFIISNWMKGSRYHQWILPAPLCAWARQINEHTSAPPSV